MISDDWSNDAENSALITGINWVLQYVKVENHFSNLQKNISQFYWVLFCIIDQINATLISRRDFFFKNMKNITDPELYICIYSKKKLQVNWTEIELNVFSNHLIHFFFFSF